LLACLVAGSGSLSAGHATIGAMQVLLLYEGHSGVLITMPGMTDSDGCGRQDYYMLHKTHAYFEQIYAMLLAAKLADRAVTINLGGCVDGMPNVRHVSI
jgi:hypothetical protein